MNIVYSTKINKYKNCLVKSMRKNFEFLGWFSPPFCYFNSSFQLSKLTKTFSGMKLDLGRRVSSDNIITVRPTTGFGLD